MISCSSSWRLHDIEELPGKEKRARDLVCGERATSLVFVLIDILTLRMLKTAHPMVCIYNEFSVQTEKQRIFASLRDCERVGEGDKAAGGRRRPVF